MKPGPKPRDPVAAFHSKYNIDPKTGCWIWNSTLNSYGYPLMGCGPKQIRAHRFSLQIATGLLGDGLHACHHCDTPACVNPGHLFWGDDAANMQDAKRKGRTGNKFQASKTHCKNGHPFSPDNLRVVGGKYPQRVCLTCSRIAGAKYDQKRGKTV